MDGVRRFLPLQETRAAKTTDLWFGTGEVASMLGVSPDTVRAWERRYQALRPVRSPSGQRRYTLEDVAHLRQIKYERHAHGLSLRLATMTAQGLVADADEEDEAQSAPPIAADNPIQVILNLIREVVVVLDDAGRVSWANVAFAKFTERRVRTIAGSKFIAFVDPYDRAKAVRMYAPEFRLRRGWELQLQGPHQHALFSFDCWPLRSSARRNLILVGTAVHQRPVQTASLSM